MGYESFNYHFTSTNFNWWSFTGIWVTVSLLRSPRLFTVFKSILIMWSGWSWFFLCLPIPPVFFSRPSKTVPSSPIRITVTFIFHSCCFFFCSLARSKYLTIFLLFFNFHSAVWRDGKTHDEAGSLFFLCCWLSFVHQRERQNPHTRYVLLVGIWWSVWIRKLQRILCVSFSGTGSGLKMYHLVVWSNFCLLHIPRGYY